MDLYKRGCFWQSTSMDLKKGGCFPEPPWILNKEVRERQTPWIDKRVIFVTYMKKQSTINKAVHRIRDMK